MLERDDGWIKKKQNGSILRSHRDCREDSRRATSYLARMQYDSRIPLLEALLEVPLKTLSETLSETLLKTLLKTPWETSLINRPDEFLHNYHKPSSVVLHVY